MKGRTVIAYYKLNQKSDKITQENHEEKFQKIRVNFLFNHPFLSVLALSIPTIFEENIKSAFSTNGAQITIYLDDDNKKIISKKIKEMDNIYEFKNKPFENAKSDSVIFKTLESRIKATKCIILEYPNMGKLTTDIFSTKPTPPL